MAAIGAAGLAGRRGAPLPYGAAVLALAAAAGALRLVRLGWMPLDPGEARLALAARSGGAAQGDVVAGPLTAHLQRLAFWLLADGDAQARVVSAAAGVVLVLLAWQLRDWLGASAALCAAGIIAVAPLWVFAGRHALGGGIAALAVVAALGAWPRGSRRSGIVVAVAAAIVLAAGGPGLSFAVATLVFLLVSALLRGPGPVIAALRARWPARRDARDAAVAFLATLLLAATGLLIRPLTLLELADVPALWWGRLGAGAPGGATGFLLPLAVYAPATLAFGLAGLAPAARHPSPLARFAATWLAVGLLLGAGVGTPALVLELLVPLTIVAALAIARLLEATRARGRLAEEGAMTAIVLVVLGYGLAQAVAFAGGADTSVDIRAATLAAAALGLAAFLLLVFAVLWSPGVAVRVLGLSALFALPVLGWANGSDLNYARTATLMEPMRPDFVAPGAEGLAAAVPAPAGEAGSTQVVVDPALRPALAWPLRAQDVVWEVPTGAADATVAVTVPGPGAEGGRPWTVAGRWSPTFENRHGFVRWWLHRRPSAAVPPPEMQQAQLTIIVE